MHISINNLFKSFSVDSHSTIIFNDLSFSFDQNKSYALIGPSGTGKSTLINMIAGIEQPCSGTITLNDKIISSASINSTTHNLSKNISLVFQQSLLIQELTVLENIMLKKMIHGSVEQYDIDRAYQLLENIGLQEKADITPNRLSGGQQQKIAILRAIFDVPNFLLADEPTGNLDQASGKQIIHLLLEYQKEYNMGLIISTHDMSIAEQCDEIIKVENKNLSKIENI